MTRKTFRTWLWVHKWTSLICTLFLLLICVTGLPLVFRDEISGWLDKGSSYAIVPEGTPRVSLDVVRDAALARHLKEIIASIFIDDDEPKIMVALAPSWTAYRTDRSSWHWIKFDAHTGTILQESKAFDGDGGRLMTFILHLHQDLFAGLPGELFLGLMATLFVVAIVSGVVLYAPFMRRLDFGTVRTERSPRLKWLDLHNFVGVVLVAWMMVVGLTGVINELSTPLFGLWQATDVKALLAPYKSRPPLSAADLVSPESAYATAVAARPGMVANSVIFPGSPFGSPYHYLIWTKGRDPLTARLFSPILVDARSGELSAVVDMPWYLRALELSRPLHFGDYGGMPLKIIWALLDLATIGVLGSGVYLWLSRRQSKTEAEEALRDSLGALIVEAAE